MKPIKVLDLFAGTQSVRKALELANIPFEYIGIDIYSPEKENTILDLSQDNIVDKLIEVLPKDWKPDFIWASPVCNKFSVVLTGMGGNYYFEVNEEDKTIKPRENWNIKVQPHMLKYQNEDGWRKAKEDALFALLLHNNTKAIIDHFKAPFAIENPSGALSRYLYKEYVKNDTNYCMYGFDYKKPTAIYNHKKLSLMKCIHKSHVAGVVGGKGKQRANHWDSCSTYANRSSVPPLLIKEIFVKAISKDAE